MRRQYSTREKFYRDYLRDKRNLIAKIRGLRMQYYEVGKNDAELYMNPDMYTCVLSENEYTIGESFSEDVEKGSIFLSCHDYEIFEGYY